MLVSRVLWYLESHMAGPLTLAFLVAIIRAWREW